MKKTLSSLVYIIIFLSDICAQNFDYQSCLDLEKKFAKYPLQQISKSTLEELKNKNSQLFVIGESHYDHLFWKMGQVYDFFKKNLSNDINCLFSEISQDTKESEIQDVLDGIMNDIFFSRYRLGFGPLYRHIYDQGDDVILVDAPRDEIVFREDENISTWLTRRDSFMITRINKALSSNQCTAGIYNIGYQHIRDRLVGDIDDSGNPIFIPYDSFGQRMKSTNVSTTIIDRGILRRNLKECHWFAGVHSFIAPVNAPIVKDIFPGLSENKTSGDYVLFLNEIESMNVLLQ